MDPHVRPVERRLVERVDDPERHSTLDRGAISTAITAEDATGLLPRVTRRLDWRRQFVYLAFVVVVVVFALLSPAFLSLSNFETIVRQAVVVTIVAVGMTFVISGREIDLSVGSTVALSMMVGALVVNTAGTWVGALAALATGLGIGLVNGLLTTKVGIPSFLVTLGMLSVGRGIALQMTGTRPVLISQPTYWRFFAEGSIGPLSAAIAWMLVVALVGYAVYQHTTFGRAVLACGGNAPAALRAGVNVARVKLITFVVTGGLAALAGLVLSARLHAARPNIADGLELDVIAAVILGGTALFGGVGTIVGTVVGSLLIATINNGLILLGLPAAMQLTIKGLIVVAAVALARR